MELRHLRSFVFVAETKSFSTAATRCCVTQSAVSQHIRALEDELGCKLLIRTSHDIMLTESGTTLLPRAKEILKQTEDCKEQINALNNCMTGELRIGVGSFIAPYIRMAALIFMDRYPNVRINADFTKAHLLNQSLRAHMLDLAFTMNMAYSHEGIESRPCIPFNVYAIMRDTHPLAALPKVSYEDLQKHPIIMPDVGERAFETCQQYIQRDLHKLNIKCIISSPDEALASVEETKYVTFMPKLYLRNHPTLVARPIVGLEQQLMSNAHWMQDVPPEASRPTLSGYNQRRGCAIHCSSGRFARAVRASTSTDIRISYKKPSLTLAAWGFFMLSLAEIIPYFTAKTLNEKHFMFSAFYSTFASSSIMNETTKTQTLCRLKLMTATMMLPARDLATQPWVSASQAWQRVCWEVAPRFWASEETTV